MLKLGIMVVPLVILTIVLSIYSGVSEMATLNEAKGIYFDELKGMIDSVLSTDRDFYQAQLGSDRAHLLEERGKTAEVQEELKDYDDNLAQVYEGLDELAAEFAEDPYLNNEFRMNGQTDSLGNMLSAAVKLVDDYKAAYDPHTHNGDYDRQYPAFQVAREDIGAMQDVIEEYAEYKNKELIAEIRNRIIVLVVILVIVIALIVFLAVSVMRYILGSTSVISNSLEKLAGGEFVEVDRYLDYEDEIGGMIKNTNS
ncbi:MAG: type II secretion system F family protein, partial [Lachnospiraceae bacterium]|nr:type II secretion system F family protein [Lachnospiraceae bacterium]